MKRIVAALVTVIVLAIPAVPVAGRSHTSYGDTIDFIRFDGAIYLSSAYLAEDGESARGAVDPGPVVGRVGSTPIDPADEAAFPNEPCLWEIPDGVAPLLLPGDDIYAVQGYATTFRLAARHRDEIVLYQVWCSDDALVGADLFDIYGRVVSIGVTGDLSEASGFAAITDPAALAALTDMLLSGPIVPEELASGAPVTHQLVFTLDDGSTFRASTAPGEVLWGLGVIEVPLAFEDALVATWENAKG